MRALVALALALVVGAVGCAETTGPGAVPPERPAPSPAVSEPPLTAIPGSDGVGLRRHPTALERGIIAQLTDDAERVRGLPFLHAVDVEIHDSARIATYVRSELDRERLLEQREMYIALGLLEEAIDLEALISSVLVEQVVGYYDPAEDRLIIRDDVMRGLHRIGSDHDETRVVLVHELVHALQDQHLELGARMDERRPNDATLAYRAVVEGDATLAMIGYMMELDADTTARLSEQSREAGAMAGALEGGGAALEGAPLILRTSLMAPYLRGLGFAAALHAEGGWRGVDDAHRRPPVSTEQVLHPEKYLLHELPDSVTLPAFSTLEAAGYRPGVDDTLGELELGVFLRAPGSGDDDDAEAASGWSGDRLRVYVHPSASRALVWWTVWDDVGEAAEAAAAARSVTGNVRVERVGRAVQILRGLPAALHRAPTLAFHAFARRLPSGPPSGAAAERFAPP